MDKEKLRQQLGRFGDVSDKLAQIFGGAYLDTPDNASTTPEDLKIKGFEVREVSASGLMGRKLERVQKISCQINQELLAAHLEFVRSNGESGRRMEAEEVWQTLVHSTNCLTSRLCHDLHAEVHVEDY